MAQATPWTVGLLVLGLALQVVPHDLPARIGGAIAERRVPDWAVAACFAVCGVMISAAGPAGVPPFIYFQF